MDRRKIIVFILIIAVVFTYNVVLGSQRICIKLYIDKPYLSIKQSLKNLFFSISPLSNNVEYEEDDFIILGGRTLLLPIKGKGINIQGYLKSKDDCCVLIIAYPALPLESY